MIRELETQDVYFKLENEILFCSYKKQLEIDIETAKRIIKDRSLFTEGKRYPVLIDFTNMKFVTKEARDYMNTPEGGLKGLLGGAFLSNNVVGTLFVNLYLKVSEPVIPAKFFTRKEEALRWLTELNNKTKGANRTNATN